MSEAPVCIVCAAEMDYEDCDCCGGEGGISRYDEDPLWYDEDDLWPCDQCNGKGGWWFCPNPQCHVVRKGG